MAETALLRGGANTTRFDDYIRAMLTKDWAALTTILTNTKGLLQNSLAQLNTIAQSVQTNADSAAASDTDAKTQAAAATASATAAKTSETNAGLSETQATTLATQCNQILSDVTDMKNVIDIGLRSFARSWLGDLAEDPTADQFGNALVAGAEYYNTTNKVIRIYTSDGKWEDISADAQTATLNAQQILTQCQTILSQVQSLHDEVMAQIATSIRNNYGLSSGKYGLYAGLYDTTNSAPANAGSVFFCYKDANSNDVWSAMASLMDLHVSVGAEQTARASAITNLENEKVNRSGDTISYLNATGLVRVGFGTEFVGNTTQGSFQYTNALYIGNPSGNFSQGRYESTISIQRQVGNESGNLSGLLFTNRDATGAVSSVVFGWNGTITGSKYGLVAFSSDVVSETTARTSAVTNLENEKVNRSGDTITYLNATGGVALTPTAYTASHNTGDFYGYPGFTSYNLDKSFLFSLSLQEHVGTQYQGLINLHGTNSDGSIVDRSIIVPPTGSILDTVNGAIAYATDITTEQSTRSTAITNLENEKANRAGDTMGWLNISTGDILGNYDANAGRHTDGNFYAFTKFSSQTLARDFGFSIFLQEHTGFQYQGLLNLHGTGYDRSIIVPQSGRLSDSKNGDVAYLSDVTSLTTTVSAFQTTQNNQNSAFSDQLSHKVGTMENDDGTNSPITGLSHNNASGAPWVSSQKVGPYGIVASRPGSGFNQVYGISTNSSGVLIAPDSSGVSRTYAPSTATFGSGYYRIVIGGMAILCFSTTTYDYALVSFPVAFSGTPMSVSVVSTQDTGTGQSVPINIVNGSLNEFNFSPHMSRISGSNQYAIASPGLQVWVTAIGPA